MNGHWEAIFVTCECCGCGLDLRDKIGALKLSFDEVCDQCGLPTERRLLLVKAAEHYGLRDPKEMKHCFFMGGCDLSAVQVKERMRSAKTGPFKNVLIEWYELGAFLDGCALKFADKD